MNLTEVLTADLIPAKQSKRKRIKANYIKSLAVRELETLAMNEAKQLHPDCPALAPRKFRDDGSNNLTKCVVEYIRLSGGFASRINNQGTFSFKLNKYIPGTSKRGLPDIIGTHQSGRSMMIEVKANGDKMRPEQEKIKQEQERVNGLFYIAKNFTDFKTWFDSLVT